MVYASIWVYEILHDATLCMYSVNKSVKLSESVCLIAVETYGNFSKNLTPRTTVSSVTLLNPLKVLSHTWYEFSRDLMIQVWGVGHDSKYYCETFFVAIGFWGVIFCYVFGLFWIFFFLFFCRVGVGGQQWDCF